MTTATHATPVASHERIQSLDVIRGVALFGILLMNIHAFGLPIALGNPTPEDTGPNLWTWIVMNMFFEGTQRGLFSLLFGAGFILLTSRLEASGRSDVADIYYRRSIWLIIFGVIHAYLLLFFGEVLFFYGTIALILYPLRKLAPKVMLTMAAVSLAAGVIWSLGELQISVNKWERGVTAQAVLDVGNKLSDEQQADLDAWTAEKENAKPDAKAIRKDIEAHQGLYLEVLRFTAPLARNFESVIHYRLFFEFFAMMLIGMALFKLGVLTLKQPLRVYWLMTLTGYAIGLAINYRELRIVLDSGFAPLAMMEAHWTYDIGRLAMTMGHLGTLALFCRSGWLGWLQRSLGAVGRMALSNYVSHSIICAFVFYGFGFGLYGELEHYQLYYVVVLIWVFQLIVSPIWLKYFRFGPLEWVWRSLTYLEKPPMRKRVVPGETLAA